MAKDKVTFTRTSKARSSKINMADRRKQISRIYSGSDEGLRRIVGTASGSNYGNLFTEEGLQRVIDQVGLETIERDDIARISKFAYATEPVYETMINYYADMFLWRYYYFPVQIRDTANEGEYGEVYDLMTNIVDGLSIETTFPSILSKLEREGVVYLYTERNTASKTISTITLNPKYCKPVMMSQYATGIFQFDTKYFDDLGIRGEALEAILELFPDELVRAYLDYKTGSGEQEVIVDGRYSTYIQLNESNFPSKLSVLKGLFDYNKYRKNEVERSSAQLDRIITHKIPTYENNLLFELPEVQELHKSMSKMITSNNSNKRTRLMTTFGDVAVHPLQEDSSVQNDALEKANSAIFRSSGLNNGIFNGSTQDSLNISLTRDQSYVWNHIQKLLNFYNLAINNLYNFRGYQIEISMLPITHYNHKDLMEMYRRNAEYGIGRLESIVASGTKQKHIAPKSKLEDFLELDKVLKPLESSHTRSGKEESKKEDSPDEPDIESEDGNEEEE